MDGSRAMTKTVKIIGSIITIIIVLLIVTGFILSKVFDPNKYRDQIEHYVAKNTGRELIIQGKIRWSLFPTLGLNLHNVSIGNPISFVGPKLATIKKLKLKASLLALLTGKVDVDEIVIEHADINLITDKENQNNWQHWSSPKPAIIAKQTVTDTQKTTSEPQKIPLRALSIKKFKVTESNIHIINYRTDITWNLHNVNFVVKDFVHNKKFPTILSCTLNETESNNFYRSKLSTVAKLNFLTQEINLSKFEFQSILLRPNLPELPIDVKSEIAINLQHQTLAVNDLAITLGNMQINGEIDIKQLLDIPELHINLESQKTNLEQLLAILQNKKYLAGMLSFNTQLNATGSSKQELLSSLNGAGNISITNGSIKGIDVERLLSRALAYINKTPQPDETGGRDQTPFSKVSATYKIMNGILTNEDLQLDANRLSATGSGTIDFPKSQIDYTLNAQYSGAAQKNVEDFSLPISISGNLYNPKILPNFGAIAAKYIKKQINNFMHDKSKNITKALKNLIN